MLFVSIWKKDKIYATGLGLILSFYALLHLIGLQVFPFYLFAMYSLPLDTPQAHAVYKIYDSAGNEVDLSSYNYRDFVYVHNTIEAYAAIVESPRKSPKIDVIDKFIDRLHIENTSAAEKLLDQYSHKDAQVNFQLWLARKLDKSPPFTIQACEYRWIEGKLSLKECKTVKDE